MGNDPDQSKRPSLIQDLGFYNNVVRMFRFHLLVDLSPAGDVDSG